MEQMIEKSEKQRLMHKNLFDKIKNAVHCEFYLEAIFLEYSAVEGRLETIMGVLNLPCNKDLPADIRKEFKISMRIECLKKAYLCGDDVFVSSKLNKTFWERLKKWIRNRNMYVHGLYKNAEVYKERINDLRLIAEEGFELVNLVYNETKRIRAKQKKNKYGYISECSKKRECPLYKKEKNE